LFKGSLGRKSKQLPTAANLGFGATKTWTNRNLIPNQKRAIKSGTECSPRKGVFLLKEEGGSEGQTDRENFNQTSEGK